jgi:hypothetical protein
MLKPIKDASQEEQLLRGMIVLEGIASAGSELDDLPELDDDYDNCNMYNGDPFTFSRIPLSRKSALKTLEQRQRYNNAIYRITHALNKHPCGQHHADWILEIEIWEKDLLEMGMCNPEKELEKWYVK